MSPRAHQMSQPASTAAAVAVACALTLACLASLFRTFGYLGPALLAIAVVVLAGEAVRLVRLPPALGPVLSGLGVFALLTALYARAGAHLLVVPDGRSLAELGATIGSGFGDVRTYAAPAPATHGLVALVVVGVAAMTLVCYLLAATLESAGLAGAPLLGGYLVATVLSPHGVGLLASAAIGVGYLVLLGSGARGALLRWGRVIIPIDGARTVRPPAGLRIGAVTMLAALVVPSLLPFLHDRRLSNGDGLSAGAGQTTVTVNPILTLGQDLSNPTAIPLLMVQSNDPQPDYLQLTVLDKYTDGSWVAAHDLQASAAARVDRGLPAPRLPAAIPALPVRDRILLLGPLDVHWLPVPFPLTGVQVAGDWRYDPAYATVFSVRQTTAAVSSYQVQALHLQPSAAELAAAPAGPLPAADLQLPANLPAVLRSIARRVVAGHQGELSRTLAIQDYLNSPLFHYSTIVPDADGSAALVDFLTVSHTGYCVQFAAAMAVLARAVGIPARVAIGFTAGTPASGSTAGTPASGFTAGTPTSNDTWLVSTQDAHAWPEIYFPQVGWLRFEPTPRADGQATVPGYATAAQSSSPPGASKAGTPGGSGATPKPAQGVPLPLRRLAHANGGPAAATRQPGVAGWPLPLAVSLVALLLAAGPAVARKVVRRRRAREPGGAARAEALWAELGDTARDLGLGWVSTDSPRRSAAALAARCPLSPAALVALDGLVSSVEVARYAPRGYLPADRRPELRIMIRALGRLAGRRRRWRARLLPVSVLSRLIPQP